MPRQPQKKAKLMSAVAAYAAKHGISTEFWENQCKQLEETTNKINGLSTKMMTNENVSIVIAWKESSENFFVTKVDDLMELKSLQKVLQKLLATISLEERVYVLQKGVVCASKIANVWHRAVVERVYLNESCKVRLLDFGRLEVVKWHDLAMLESCLLQTPPLAIQCQLAIDRMHHQCHNVDEKFSEFCAQSTGLCVAVREWLNGICSVELMSDEQRFDTFLFASVGDEVNNNSENNEVVAKASNEFEPVVGIGSCLSSEFLPNAIEEKVCLETKTEDNLSKNNSTSREESLNAHSQIDSHAPDAVARENTADTDDNNESLDATSNQQAKYPKPIHVKIIHFANPDEFYICRKKDVAALNFLHQRVQLIGANFGDMDVIEERLWSEQDLCLVYEITVTDWHGHVLPYKWFRGRIQHIDDDSVVVYLLDIGITIECDTFALYPIDADVMNVQSIIKCSLACIRPIADEWNDQCTDQIRSFSIDFSSIAISSQIAMDDIEPKVILWGINVSRTALTAAVPAWTNLNQRLIDVGVAVLSHPFADVDFAIEQSIDTDLPDASLVSATLDDNDAETCTGSLDQFYLVTEPNMYVVNDARELVQQWLPSVPILKIHFNGRPTYVDSRCRIYLMDSYRHYLANQMKIVINRMVEKEVGEPNTTWKRNEPCLARFDSDGLYYRAEIRRVNDEKRRCRVRFVDYGNLAMVEWKHLRVADICGSIPILTRRYCLQNIQPTADDGEWREDVIDYVRFRLIDHICAVKVYCQSSDQSDAVCEIRGNDVIDIRTDLLGLGFAKKIE